MSSSVAPVSTVPAEFAIVEHEPAGISMQDEAGPVTDARSEQADVVVGDFEAQIAFMNLVFINQQLLRARASNEERLREIRSEE